VILFSACPALATVISQVPGNFVLDGQIGEWNGIPPAEQIRYSGSTTESDSFWLGRSRWGLVVAGLIRNHRWSFATDISELATSGRLEIWLSVAEAFDLPEIKYDEEACAAAPKPEEKNSCLQWMQEQADFREKLQRQATRVWRLAPNAAEEAYAVPAYDGFTDGQRKALRFERPAGLPVSQFRTSADGSATFEVLIPWEVFPPADRLNIERVRLAVNIKSNFEGSPPNAAAVRENLPLYAISPAITTRITTCGQPLLGKNLHGEDEAAFYFLNRSLVIDRAFFFGNPEEAYGHPLPEKDEVSPIASYQTFSTQALGNNEFLCAPFMSYRKGQVTKNFPFRLEPPGDQWSRNGLTTFPVKRLPDGTLLIRYGPDIASGPLWHKAFVVYSMRIYVLTPSLLAYEALSLGAWSDAVPGYELEWTDDWRTVTEFRQNQAGVWTSERFCLAGHTYRSCGKDMASPPPRKRVLTSGQ